MHCSESEVASAAVSHLEFNHNPSLVVAESPAWIEILVRKPSNVDVSRLLSICAPAETKGKQSGEKHLANRYLSHIISPQLLASAKFNRSEAGLGPLICTVRIEAHIR